MLDDAFWLQLLRVLDMLESYWGCRALLGDKEGWRRCKELARLGAAICKRTRSTEARRIATERWQRWLIWRPATTTSVRQRHRIVMERKLALDDNFWLNLVKAMDAIAWRCWLKRAFIHGDERYVKRCQSLVPIALKIRELVQSPSARSIVDKYHSIWLAHFYPPTMVRRRVKGER